MQKLPVNRNGQYEVKQSTAGPATRKRSRELMQGTDLLQLPSPVPQKKEIEPNNKKFVCAFCDKAFSKKTTCLNHVRIHTGESEKPYSCEFCDKKFAQKFQLSTHLRGHTGERPYKCTLCGLSFSTQTILKNHLLTHTGELPHVCEFCNERFMYKRQLKPHILTAHTAS